MDAQSLLERTIKLPIKSYGTTNVEKDQESSTTKGNSWILTGAIMYSNTIGAVGLETAAAVNDMGGWLLGSVALMGGVWVNMHICIIVWRLAMCFPEQGFGIFGPYHSRCFFCR
jgi:hypothetical protein